MWGPSTLLPTFVFLWPPVVENAQETRRKPEPRSTSEIFEWALGIR